MAATPKIAPPEQRREHAIQQAKSMTLGNMRANGVRPHGAYFQINPAVERMAERLPRLLEAVAHYAIGGTLALEGLPVCGLVA
jgi:hypothetical protein